jgi:hypothetical protein
VTCHPMGKNYGYRTPGGPGFPHGVKPGFGIGFTGTLLLARAPRLLAILLSHTQYPFPPRSLVCDGQTVTQTSPHKPRLVVSHSTCPPLSSFPHAHSLHFVLGTAVINNNLWRLSAPCKRPQGDTLPQQEPGIIVDTCTKLPEPRVHLCRPSM